MSVASILFLIQKGVQALRVTGDNLGQPFKSHYFRAIPPAPIYHTELYCVF